MADFDGTCHNLSDSVCFVGSQFLFKHMQVLFESMGIGQMSLATLIKDSNSPIVMIEGLSGATAEWYESPHTTIMPSSYFIHRYEERIRIMQTKVTPQMRQLRQFKGLIGSPVNHNNVHWGLLIIDRQGKPFYYDSLSRKVDKRIRLMAQCVPSLYHILLSPL